MGFAQDSPRVVNEFPATPPSSRPGIVALTWTEPLSDGAAAISSYRVQRRWVMGGAETRGVGGNTIGKHHLFCFSREWSWWVFPTCASVDFTCFTLNYLQPRVSTSFRLGGSSCEGGRSLKKDAKKQIN